jgi:toxin ParE1/3/4
VYNVLISDESRLDILDAFSWYESRLPGLGKEFELCLNKGFLKIQQDPLLFQVRYRELHIYFIEKFPFEYTIKLKTSQLKYSAFFIPAEILGIGL